LNKVIDKNMVTVVIPTFNEEKAIGLVLDEVRAAGFKNVLVVDGYSVDATTKIAESRGVQVVLQNGRGKTGAIRTAVDFVKTPYMLVMDGDYTYCAKDIERFLNHGGRYVHVIGVRSRAYMNWIHRVGNWVITRAFNLFLGAGLSDVCSGMYLLRTDVARRLELRSKGFRTEVEVLAQTVMDGDVTEVPVSYRPRVGKRKLSTWRHGLEILWSLFGLARSYNPVFLFSLLAALATVPGVLAVGWALYAKFFLGRWEFNWLLFGSILFLFGALGWAVATVSLLLKRMERRIMQSLRKE
jgi:dolichol-phosphate mannosyltransferase